MPLSLDDKEWLLQQFHALKGFIAMATQDEVDAITAQLTELQSSLSADDSAIQQEIASLEASNPDVDLTGLKTAVSALSAQVDATAALVPAPVTSVGDDSGAAAADTAPPVSAGDGSTSGDEGPNPAAVPPGV